MRHPTPPPAVNVTDAYCTVTDVKNYFAEIEQVAFAPSHLIPGIEPSADPVLQSRLFAYPDAHRYRLCACRVSVLALSLA